MYYFASDIHLGAGDDRLTRCIERRFTAWLDVAGRDAQAIFILGDMFDFWFEYKRVVPKGFVRVLGKLAELTDRGVRIVLITGNHDMWVGDYLSKECGIEVYTKPQTFTLCGKTLFMAHGDNMNIDNLPMLRLMNWTFRSSVLRVVFSWLVHPDLAIKFGQWWSNSSQKHHKKSDGKDIAATDPLIEYARKYAQTHDIDYFVFGHMHFPRDYNESGLRVINLGCWAIEPPYAVMDADGVISLQNTEL